MIVLNTFLCLMGGHLQELGWLSVYSYFHYLDRTLKIIDLLATDKSRYFAQPHLGYNCLLFMTTRLLLSCNCRSSRP